MATRSATRDLDLNSREEWILRLLYTPDTDGVSKPVFGRTRIMKALFLLHRKLKEVFDEDSGFDFVAYRYGPFDKSVYMALERLEERGLVRIQPPEDHIHARNEPKYTLTENGTDVARRLYEDLPTRQQELLAWVKYEQASRPLGSFLSYIYTQYPNMTTESEIDPGV